MSNLKKTKFTLNSEEVKNAKVSRDHFVTTILGCNTVNGSKYKPNHWRYDIQEIETSDGVFISETVTTEHIGKSIRVWSGKNDVDIGWIWLNLVSVEGVSDEPKFYEIQEALSLNVPNTTCFVYKIELGNECYVGFTTQNPEQRLNGHISKSKEGGMQKINKAFRKWGYIYSNFEVIGEYKNEIEGLLSEIRNIDKFNCSLNENLGGQGKDFNIVPNKNNFDEEIFTVHDKNSILNSY